MRQDLATLEKRYKRATGWQRSRSRDYSSRAERCSSYGQLALEFPIL